VKNETQNNQTKGDKVMTGQQRRRLEDADHLATLVSARRTGCGVYAVWTREEHPQDEEFLGEVWWSRVLNGWTHTMATTKKWATRKKALMDMLEEYCRLEWFGT